MDSKRAQQIIESSDNIQVLYHGSPVWLENVKDNNSVVVTFLDSNNRDEVPAYKLVENNPNTQM